MKIRVGQGYDVHAFGVGDHLMLAGVRVDFDRGLVAHSDGDVALHALMDALLGAAGLGDIGVFFPDTDEQYSGMSSRILLACVVKQIKAGGWAIANVDVTIVAQLPKLALYKSAMRQVIADDLGISGTEVNVKATTTEGLGFVGQLQGIAAHAVALLYHSP